MIVAERKPMKEILNSKAYSQDSKALSIIYNYLIQLRWIMYSEHSRNRNTIFVSTLSLVYKSIEQTSIVPVHSGHNRIMKQ